MIGYLFGIDRVLSDYILLVKKRGWKSLLFNFSYLIYLFFNYRIFKTFWIFTMKLAKFYVPRKTSMTSC